MFGFLKLQNCGITAEERLIYRSHFCSVCHAMTSFGGKVSSLLTNYDITFWLLLCSALETKSPTKVENLRCTAVPFRRVKVRPLNLEVGKTMAALNLTLVQSKVKDDEVDGESMKAGVANALFRKKFDKAQAYLTEIGFPIDSITGLPGRQCRAEASEAPTLESLSQPTAHTLGEIFSVIAVLHKQPKLGDDLRNLGRSLGAYLYLWDALMDLEQDKKKGAFNAILATSGGDLTDVRTSLFIHLSEVDEILNSLALGPEGSLCHKLSTSLGRRLVERFPKAARAQRSIRPRLAKAGFVHAQSCDCCECEVDCCECGSCCDCNCCNCDPCGTDHSHCCEFNCCDVVCCCCGDSGSSRTPTRSTCCLDDCIDCLCLESLCCGESRSHSSSKYSRPTITPSVPLGKSFFDRFRTVKNSVSSTTVSGESRRKCPSCNLSMMKLSVGDIHVDECRNCGGIWLDDKEIDVLARMPRLPHNLLNRYPAEEHPLKYLPGERECPACTDGERKLFSVPYLKVPVEMCKECHGFWLGHGVLRRVLKAKRSPRRLLASHRKEWRCPYCEQVAEGGADVCQHCGAPRPRSGFTGKLA